MRRTAVCAVALTLAGCGALWQPSGETPPARPRRESPAVLAETAAFLARPATGIDLAEALGALRRDVARDLPDGLPAVCDGGTRMARAVATWREHLARLDVSGEARAVALVAFLFDGLGIVALADTDADTPPEGGASSFPEDVLACGRGGCLGLGGVALALARASDVPLRGVLVGTHFFVRFDDGVVRRNFELLRRGHSHPDWYYRERFGVPPAAGAYLRALDTREVLAVFLYNVAGIYRGARRGAEARALYERVVEILPGFAEARGNLASLDAQAGDAALAAAELNAVIRERADLAGAYVNLAAIYAELGRHDEAAAVCRAGLAAKRDDAALHHALGTVYHRQERFTDAVSEYERALVLDKSFARAHLNLAKIYTSIGREDLAKHHARKALAIDAAAAGR